MAHEEGNYPFYGLASTRRAKSILRLRVGEDHSIVEGDVQLGVLAMEIILQSVEISAAFPLAHGQVVKEIVATSLGLSGRHLALGNNPLEAFYCEATHVVYAISASHDEIHAREASHGPHIHHIIFHSRIAKPCSH